MARLRNRMVKADFWTDPELLRWPLAKRVMYQGLWAMAEDSGCVEDDSFGWKLILFPSPMDSEVTTDVLEGWRDELSDAGKLLPYEADGKRYLYLRNFHQHERPRNPQRPDLPLPAWVQHDVIESKRGDSTVSRHSYGVLSALLPSQNGDSTVIITSPPPRLAPSSPVPSSPVVKDSTPSTVVDVADKAPDPAPPPERPVEKQCTASGSPSEGSQANDKDSTPPRSKASRPKDSQRFTPQTCDGGEPCQCLQLKCGIRQIVFRIDPQHAGAVYNRDTDLGRQMARLAAYICTQSQDKLPTLERPQREKACQRMLVTAVQRMADAHTKKPITNLPAYIVGILKREDLTEVIGDELLIDLRREASAAYGGESFGAALVGKVGG